MVGGAVPKITLEALKAKPERLGVAAVTVKVTVVAVLA